MFKLIAPLLLSLLSAKAYVPALLPVREGAHRVASSPRMSDDEASRLEAAWKSSGGVPAQRKGQHSAFNAVGSQRAAVPVYRSHLSPRQDRERWVAARRGSHGHRRAGTHYTDADRGTLGEYYSEGDQCLRVLRMIIRSQERYQKHVAGLDMPRDDA